MVSTAGLRAGRVLVVATAALVALALGSGPVLAETELGHTGKVGNYQINDVQGYPVICHHFAPYGRLRSIEVHPVTLYARNTGAGRQKQKVGWQMVLLREKPGHKTWKVFYRSGILKADAWDDQSAAFPTRSINSVTFPDDTSAYRLRAKMFWYKHGAVVGTAVSQFDFYHEQDDFSSVEADTGFCFGVFLV